MNPCLKLLGCAAVLWAFLPPLTAGAENARIEFNRDVRPILSENCFQCHGPDSAARRAGLRLDIEAADRGGVIVPGQPGESELIRRIFHSDPGERMPPPDSNRQLDSEQKELLRQWIGQGASYENHWAFTPPKRHAPPPVRQKDWPRNAIDNFILARLEEENLSPSKPAPIPQLLRRAALDLTGVPAEPAQLRRWMRAHDPLLAAVDELLASPRFGERMASDWMDVARYADTHGFNNDSMRGMWRWRDWVIEAFNANMPYDRFIEEQLAGDLLPEPALDQIIATAFNRNHVINSEGGIIGEEYRLEYVSDRVRTVSMSWLGLTMDCARCHDHKFDPISQQEYYQLFAFFNNIDEHGEAGRLANAAPLISAPTALQRREMERRRREMREAELKMERLADSDISEIRIDAVPIPDTALEIDAADRIVHFDLSAGFMVDGVLTNAAGGKPFQAGGSPRIISGPAGSGALLFDGKTSLKTDQLPNPARNWAFSAWVRRDQAVEGPLFSTMNFDLPRSFERYGRGVEIRFDAEGAVEVRLVNAWPSYSLTIQTRERVGLGEWRHLIVFSDGSAKPGGLKVFLDGEECFREILHEDFGDANIAGAARIGYSGEENSRRFAGALANYRLIARPNLEELLLEARAERLRAAVATLDEFGTIGEAFQSADSAEGGPVRAAAEILRAAWMGRHHAEFAAAREARETARAALLDIERQVPTLMVMRELPEPRETRILLRGEYDKPLDKVEPGVPAILPPFPEDQPRNRLGLARWLTDPHHPLTARVVVNRFWQNLFGTGLVKSAEDFGYQSDWPSHPELLDWLAVEFVEANWDVKQMLRLMLTSATYRQDSASSPELNERDPENRLLARGPRQRLTGEMLRDQALAVSGLLEEELGGPPVFPYQPADLYKGIVVAANYPGTEYVESEGTGLYRRSLYTFWKRTVPHPTFTAFDAPDREFCVARRVKTNTPLQALATMNDTVQLEAARKMAERLLIEGGTSAGERIRWAFLLATAREPDSVELAVLQSFLERRVAFYRDEPEAAAAFLSVGASPRDEALDSAELAAYANLASLILNLDETIHRN